MTAVIAPTLTWTGNFQTGWTAVGRRGVYTIGSSSQHVGVLVVLRCVGHDGLPIVQLPPYGKQCMNVDQAKEAAAQLERSHLVESEISGC